MKTEKDKIYMGLDIGSVSINTVVISGEGTLLASDYRRTRGRVVEAVRESLRWFRDIFPGHEKPDGLGTTGSGRYLAAVLTGADLIKNEITAHTAAAVHSYPDVRTLLEIGGEDSKIVIIRDGLPVDFAMNTLCAAGTGAFLDQLAGRLGVPVEDLGGMSERAENETAVSGRCTVFAESDIIFKQQAGFPLEDIVKGLCRSMVRNYLGDTARGKEILGPVVFQGGVAANTGIRRALEEELGLEILIPEYFSVMGALGSALLTRNFMSGKKMESGMKPIEMVLDSDFCTESFSCGHCGNNCEILRFTENGVPCGYQGGRCERWQV